MNCKTQAEVDILLEEALRRRRRGQCGWLTDKFGLSWQIVPAVLSEMLNGKDAAKSQRVMHAMLKWTRSTSETLEEGLRRKIRCEPE